MTRRLLLVDATPGRLISANTGYIAGASMFAGAFDRVVHVRTPQDVYAALERHTPRHVQVWGHGAPGAPLVGGKALSPDHVSWTAADEVWFRSCYVARGHRGHDFMNALAAQGVAAVAHLGIIGAWGHSYLVGVRPHARAWWSKQLAPPPSRPWQPRTVSFATMRLPSWAYDEARL